MTFLTQGYIKPTDNLRTLMKTVCAIIVWGFSKLLNFNL